MDRILPVGPWADQCGELIVQAVTCLKPDSLPTGWRTTVCVCLSVRLFVPLLFLCQFAHWCEHVGARVSLHWFGLDHVVFVGGLVGRSVAWSVGR